MNLRLIHQDGYATDKCTSAVRPFLELSLMSKLPSIGLPNEGLELKNDC